MKAEEKKSIRIGWLLLILLVIMGIFGVRRTYGAETVSQRTVRVGFFSADGYHVMDSDGSMSGYGYDFLQMMLRYNNWSYEYVGYDKNWGDMLQMLKDGDIDMVTLANKTPEREELYDFSDKSIGTSSTIMTISAENTVITPGDYKTYDGAVVGLVEGSSHNAKFEEYALQKGFTYTPVYYDDIANLLNDLRAGEKLDIAVTSNMRLIHDEVILDEFNSTEYYVLVRKGDQTLLDEINKGIAQLSVYSPDWRSSLFEKYYSDINSKVISLSVDEREYLDQLKKDGTVIKAAMNPELGPYSYFQDGEPRGIAPAIFAEVANRLGLDYVILTSENRWDYKNQLQSGEADVDLTAYLDYSLAQRYNLKETDAYISSTLALLNRRGANLDKNDMVVAIVRDPTEYIGFNKDLITPYQVKEYESIQECIDAVKRGEADATFRYVYIAEQAVKADYTNRLQYTILPEYTFNLCLGISNDRDHRLLSTLNKAVNSLTPAFTQGVILEESMAVEPKQPVMAIAYDHPVLVVAAATFLVLILCLLVLLLVINRGQKNRILASKETNRFIGYVCETYDLVTEFNLRTRRRTDYCMKDGQLVEEQREYRNLDEAYFAGLTENPDDQKLMAEAFSENVIGQMIKEGGAERYLECRLKNEAGEYRWYSYIIKAIAQDEQHPQNYVVFKKDIQDAKTDEEKQKQILRDALQAAKSASAAKGTFLSRMSHEIRTPLNAVIGYMSIAKDSADNPEKILHCVENSETAAKHLLSIINDVLDISSIESGRMKIAREEFDLRSQITTVSTMFFNQAKAKKVQFDVTLEGVTQEWVIGDSLRLNQILMNLLSNAVKFTPEGGNVKLSVTQVSTDEKNVFMRFTIQDTGIGMSEEYLTRMFRPFEQESASTAQKYGGTGLGLSVTRNLIDLMGGSIEVTSHQGEGSTFVVSLHFERSDSEHEQHRNPADYSHVRVLIVDDDKDSCEYMKGLLKRCSVKCDVVFNGESALKRIQGRAGTKYAYDMCLMDWNMPGMNGIETARRIRRECDPNLPIIIATAYDVTEVTDEAKEIGVNRVIAKPLFQSTMFDLLVSTYGKYEPEAPKKRNMELIRGLRILLAEDNPMNMEIAVEILNKAGLVVDTAVDGKQAFDRFTQSPQGSYDAILMDIQMPVMDGYQATAEIRKSTHPEARTIPIIAMTANAFVEDVNAALASGMNGHIAKPVDYDKLYEVLEKFCLKKAEQ